METILIAPNAFKGTLSPAAVAHAIDAGIQRAISDGLNARTVLLPMADGGDGTLQAVHLSAGGQMRALKVQGPTGIPHPTNWLQLGDEALVELASACGLALLADELEPMRSNTFGLGQTIRHCLERGIERINVAVGGSASTDGGCGALTALGAQFTDQRGVQLSELGGGALRSISKCDLSALRTVIGQARLRVLTDVTNPLLGDNGAAAIFAPQKGATPEQVRELEAGLKHFADVLEKASGCHKRELPGAGAAGGSAFGLACAAGAELISGFDFIAAIARLDEKLDSATLVITGEGKFDQQSLSGKVIGELLRRCRNRDKRLWVVAGCAEYVDAAGVERVCVPSKSGQLCTADEISQSVFEALSVSRIFHE